MVRARVELYRNDLREEQKLLQVSGRFEFIEDSIYQDGKSDWGLNRGFMVLNYFGCFEWSSYLITFTLNVVDDLWSSLSS